MAYNTKAIKTDLNAKPIPQYYNPVTDKYEVLQGVGGAARQVLYGPNGQPITTTMGKLAVRATELEEKIEAVRVLLNALAKKDFATQTTLAQILGKMIASPATEAKQDSLATLVGAIEDKLDGVIDGTTPAKTETQLTGSKVRLVRNRQTLIDPIEPEQSENISIYATAGHIATLNILSFSVGNPDDATTGHHRLYASINSTLSIERFLEFSNAYNTYVKFNTYGGYEGTEKQKEHISVIRQAINVGAIKFSDKIPLNINYLNNTDVIQTKPRYLLVVVTEEAYI